MWNEEEYIDRTLAAAREACQSLLDSGEIGDYEIVVVDVSGSRISQVRVRRIEEASEERQEA